MTTDLTYRWAMNKTCDGSRLCRLDVDDYRVTVQFFDRARMWTIVLPGRATPTLGVVEEHQLTFAAAGRHAPRASVWVPDASVGGMIDKLDRRGSGWHTFVDIADACSPAFAALEILPLRW